MMKQGVKRESGVETRDARRRAFSRCDLLAAVCTVSILIALTSVVGSPNSSSNKLVCMENVRRICQATMMYADDNEDELPYPSWGGSGEGSRVCWLYEYHPIQVNGTRHVVEEGSLWTYLRKRNIYRCPSERTNTSLFQMRTQKESSYVMNAAATGFSTGVGGVQGATFKLSQFQPDAVSFWEADEQAPFFFDDASNRPDEGLSTRHGAGVVGLFGGSAELMIMEEYQRLAGPIGSNQGSGVRPGRFWCAPDTATGD